MIRSTTRAIAAVTAAALLSACGGHGGAPAVPSAPNPVSHSNGGSFAWGQSVISQLPYQGAVTADVSLSTVVAVRMRDAEGLVQYAQQASTPGSPMYRHWLTPQEIGSRFGASQADYDAAASYLQKFGLSVGTWPQREVLAVSGTTSQFQRAFGTTFGKYLLGGKQIIAPASAPQIPSSVPIVGAVGLMNATLAQRDFIHGTSADFFGYSPQQVATGFDFSGAYANGIDGTGINVGIIGTGPILDPSGKDDDAAAYASFWHAKMAPIQQVDAIAQAPSTANGNTGTGSEDPNPAGLASPPPVTSPCTSSGIPNYTTCNPEDGEAQLDTESIASLAPGSAVLFYNAYNPGECLNPKTGALDPPSSGACPSGDVLYPLEGIGLVDDSLQQAIADNKADAISMSFGQPENFAQAFGYIAAAGSKPGVGQIEAASLVAEGIAVFASSGDDGAWECYDVNTYAPLGTPCASYPASDPNVTAVGGVNIPLDESGNLTSSITAWADNTTRGGDGSFSNNVGSGGGVSSVFAAPTWQTQTVAGASMREIPDMSLDADPNSGQSILMYGASKYQSVFASGGTSMAAPEAAAQWALVLQACKASTTCNKGGATGYRLGNPAPLYYAIYGTSKLAKGPVTGATPQLDYDHVFADVIYGGNQAVPAPAPTGTPPPTSGYESGPGYDKVTGIGAPMTAHLIQSITGTKLP